MTHTFLLLTFTWAERLTLFLTLEYLFPEEWICGEILLDLILQKKTVLFGL